MSRLNSEGPSKHHHHGGGGGMRIFFMFFRLGRHARHRVKRRPNMNRLEKQLRRGLKRDAGWVANHPMRIRSINSPRPRPLPQQRHRR